MNTTPRAEICPIPAIVRTGWQDAGGNPLYSLVPLDTLGNPAFRGGWTDKQALQIIAACEAANTSAPALALSEAVTDEMVDRALCSMEIPMSAAIGRRAMRAALTAALTPPPSRDGG